MGWQLYCRPSHVCAAPAGTFRFLLQVGFLVPPESGRSTSPSDYTQFRLKCGTRGSSTTAAPTTTAVQPQLLPQPQRLPGSVTNPWDARPARSKGSVKSGQKRIPTRASPLPTSRSSTRGSGARGSTRRRGRRPAGSPARRCRDLPVHLGSGISSWTCDYGCYYTLYRL